MASVRTKIAVRVAGGCPVSALSAGETGDGESAGGDGPAVSDVTWTRAADGRVTEEFRVSDSVAAAQPEAVADADPVVTVGDETVYRFTRDSDTPCACEVVEGLGHPISDVYASDGELILTLHLPDVDALREIVASLDEVADRVAVRYLVRSADEAADADRDPTVVDRDCLTDRQREVLRTAHEMGYFEYRGGANATAVAAELDIAQSTFAEHLAAAQGRLLEELLR